MKPGDHDRDAAAAVLFFRRGDLDAMNQILDLERTPEEMRAFVKSLLITSEAILKGLQGVLDQANLEMDPPFDETANGMIEELLRRAADA